MKKKPKKAKANLVALKAFRSIDPNNVQREARPGEPRLRWTVTYIFTFKPKPRPRRLSQYAKPRKSK